MKEDSFEIPTSDGFKIYGRISFSEDRNRNRAIVLSHGLTGNPCEFIHQAARDFFMARGYDVIRFAYYDAPVDARKLQDCTLKIHAQDINAVISHFKNNYEKIYVAGHSYGGLTVLFANPDVSAISFWDSSYHPYEGFWQEEARYLPELDCYAIGWGMLNLIGKEMYEEAKNFSKDDACRLAKALKAPAQVILAGDVSENKNRTALYDDLNDPKDFYDVPNADHIFAKERVVYELLEKTQEWFEEH